MEIKVIPREFVKYLDNDVLLIAFSELLSRRDFETLKYMKDALESPFDFPDGIDGLES